MANATVMDSTEEADDDQDKHDRSNIPPNTILMPAPKAAHTTMADSTEDTVANDILEESAEDPNTNHDRNETPIPHPHRWKQIHPGIPMTKASS